MDRLSTIGNLVTEARSVGLRIHFDGELLRIRGARKATAIAKALLDHKAEARAIRDGGCGTVVKLTDKALSEALRSLAPAERAAIESCLRAAKWADAEAQERLKSAALRRVRSLLKRRARSRPQRKFEWLK
jgi:hypothetical protein